MPISPIQEMMSRPAHTHLMARQLSQDKPEIVSPIPSRVLSTSPCDVTHNDSICGLRTVLFLLSPRSTAEDTLRPTPPIPTRVNTTSPTLIESPSSLSRSMSSMSPSEMDMEMEIEESMTASSPQPIQAQAPPPTTDTCSIWSPFAAISRAFTCLRSSHPVPPPPTQQQAPPIDEFVILTASPLVLDPVSLPHSPTPIAPLHTRDEHQQLRSLLKHSGNDNLHPIFRHLSLRTLGEELINQPSYLHLSGHGTHLADGTFVLAFEHDGLGQADLVDMDTLARLVQTSYGNGLGAPKFVVLSACYSEHAAHVFIRAGAQHVVAIRATDRVTDIAARTFTKWIWTALLRGKTIKQSFDIACCHVDVATRTTPRSMSPPILTSSVSMPAPTERTMEVVPEQVATSAPTSSPLPTTTTTTTPRTVTSPRPESSKFILLPADGNHDVVLFPTTHQIRSSSQNSTSSQPSITSHRKIISYDASTLPSSSRSSRAPSDVTSPPTNDVVTLPLFLRYSSKSPNLDRCLPTSRSPIIMPNASNSNLPALPDHLIGRELDIDRIIRMLETHRAVNIHGQPKLGKSCVAIAAAHFMCERGRFQDGCYFLSMTSALIDESSIVANLCYVLGINTTIPSLRRLLTIIRDWDALLILDDGASQYTVALIVQIIRHTTRIKIISTSIQNQTLVLPNIHHSQSITMGNVPIRQLSMHHCVQLIRALCTATPSTSPLIALNDQQIITLIQKCHFSPYHIRLAIRTYMTKIAQSQLPQPQHVELSDISRPESSHEPEISQSRISLCESQIVA